MLEIFRTNDPAEIALAKSLLESAKIHFFVFDEHLNNSLGIDAFECRFMVLEDEAEDAKAIFAEAGFYDTEVEISATTDKAEADALEKRLLDETEFEFFIDEEDIHDGGLISGFGNTTVKYRFKVMDYDLDEARAALKKLGVAK